MSDRRARRVLLKCPLIPRWVGDPGLVSSGTGQAEGLLMMVEDSEIGVKGRLALVSAGGQVRLEYPQNLSSCGSLLDPPITETRDKLVTLRVEGSGRHHTRLW
jgi:hypothetical protein